MLTSAFLAPGHLIKTQLFLDRPLRWQHPYPPTHRSLLLAGVVVPRLPRQAGSKGLLQPSFPQCASKGHGFVFLQNYFAWPNCPFPTGTMAIGLWLLGEEVLNNQ